MEENLAVNHIKDEALYQKEFVVEKDNKFIDHNSLYPKKHYIYSLCTSYQGSFAKKFHSIAYDIPSNIINNIAYEHGNKSMLGRASLYVKKSISNSLTTRASKLLFPELYKYLTSMLSKQNFCENTIQYVASPFSDMGKKISLGMNCLKELSRDSNNKACIEIFSKIKTGEALENFYDTITKMSEIISQDLRRKIYNNIARNILEIARDNNSILFKLIELVASPDIELASKIYPKGHIECMKQLSNIFYGTDVQTTVDRAFKLTRKQLESLRRELPSKDFINNLPSRLSPLALINLMLSRNIHYLPIDVLIHDLSQDLHPYTEDNASSVQIVSIVEALKDSKDTEEVLKKIKYILENSQESQEIYLKTIETFISNISIAISFLDHISRTNYQIDSPGYKPSTVEYKLLNSIFISKLDEILEKRMQKILSKFFYVIVSTLKSKSNMAKFAVSIYQKFAPDKYSISKNNDDLFQELSKSLLKIFHKKVKKYNGAKEEAFIESPTHSNNLMSEILIKILDTEAVDEALNTILNSLSTYASSVFSINLSAYRDNLQDAVSEKVQKTLKVAKQINTDYNCALDFSTQYMASNIISLLNTNNKNRFKPLNMQAMPSANLLLYLQYIENSPLENHCFIYEKSFLSIKNIINKRKIDNSTLLVDNTLRQKMFNISNPYLIIITIISMLESI
ncbi:MAG: hypothetical protein KAH32_00790 [Chlamydiia bacterium]|nr:hypothetical protein [Chlamydiia bacterium]